jgi:hypothetical protein
MFQSPEAGDAEGVFIAAAIKTPSAFTDHINQDRCHAARGLLLYRIEMCKPHGL